MANAVPSFGSFVWYEFVNSAVTVPQFRAALNGAGFDQIVVGNIDEVSEVRTAARRWKSGRGNADRYKSEIAHEDDAMITIGILRREQVSSKKVGWVQVDSLAFDKVSTDWISRGASAEADLFREFADHRRVFVDHEQIRPVLQGLLDSLAPIRLRKQGGIYFIPASDLANEMLPRIVQFMDAIGDSYVSVAEQTSDSARVSTIREVRSGLAESIQALREQMGDWKSKIRNPRKDAVDNALAEFADLRDRADLYASALEIRLDDLRSEIGEIESVARSFVRGGEEVRKAPSAGLVALLADLVESVDPGEDGSRQISISDLDGSGLPEATYGENAVRYWKADTGAVRALASIGYSVKVEVDGEGESVDTILVITPVADSESDSGSGEE